MSTITALRLTSELEVTAPLFKTLKCCVMTHNRKIIACATFSQCCSVHKQRGACEKPCENIYINQQDAQIFVIKLYFPLGALHVSDHIIPSSRATL